MLPTNDLPCALPREMMKHTYPILYEVEESHWWHIGRRRIIGSFVREICSKITDHHSQILDVGCGGSVVRRMAAVLKYAGEPNGINGSAGINITSKKCLPPRSQ